MVQKKKLNFDYKNFGKFKDKIDYIIVDKEPPKTPEIRMLQVPAIG